MDLLGKSRSSSLSSSYFLEALINQISCNSLQMHPQLFPSPFLFILIIFFVFLHVPISLCNDDNERYLNCRRPFECGSIKSIIYPFWGRDRPDYCGHPGFELECHDDITEIQIMTQRYRVLGITPDSQTLTVARDDFWNNTCPSRFANTTLNLTIFNYASTARNLTLRYNCTINDIPVIPTLGPSSQFNCSINQTTLNAFFTTKPISSTETNLWKCNNNVIVPVHRTAASALERNATTLVDALDGGFELQWTIGSATCNQCLGSGGQCGYNSTSGQFNCLCSDQPYNTTCLTQGTSSGKDSTKKKLIIAASTTTIFVAMITFCCWRFRSFLFNSVVFWKNSRNAQNVEVFLRDYGSLVPKRYKYLDIKKMTDSFKNKIGQGGYGGVFKGKLLDGCLVAVKILSKSKGNGEEFINEVASISKTSHVNIVSLLGFCVEGDKRALIYEFMPNGSLEKFIYDGKPVKTHPHLGWERLYKIAVGIARGLEYLHRGCNTRILHFDIKPHNILLDEEFCPKISDFGLAKLCPRKESIISMMGARGTVGYIAPEVFSRIFGGVSHKSDVYSYGMMVLEMVGGRNNIDESANTTSETYFRHSIYKQLHSSGHLELSEILNEVDEEIARKMILVGFWCIQTNPSDRPSMNKVLEMLEGSLISLKTPPRPFISSPSRSPECSSTT